MSAYRIVLSTILIFCIPIEGNTQCSTTELLEYSLDATRKSGAYGEMARQAHSLGDESGACELNLKNLQVLAERVEVYKQCGDDFGADEATHFFRQMANAWLTRTCLEYYNNKAAGIE